MAVETYTGFKYLLARGGVHWPTDEVYAFVVGASYTFASQHRTVADVLEHALDVPRVYVSAREVAPDFEGDGASLLASSFAFPVMSESVGGVVFYIRTGADDETPADDQLIGFLEISPVADLEEQALHIDLPGQQFLFITD